MMRHSHWPPLACRVPVQSKCSLLHDPFISATPPRAHTNPLPHTLLATALLSWGTALQGLSNCCFAIFAAHMFLAILPDETPDQQASKVLQDTLARRRGKGAGRGRREDRLIGLTEVQGRYTCPVRYPLLLQISQASAPCVSIFGPCQKFLFLSVTHLRHKSFKSPWHQAQREYRLRSRLWKLEGQHHK